MWRLMCKDALLGTITVDEVDFPWLRGWFVPERSKPQCCHTCGLVPSPSAPSSRASSFPVFM
ncbi:hypothetical protein ABZS89_41465, partial [Streptomyces sp. NPDC005407]